MQAQMAAKQLELQERQTGVAEMRAQTDAAVAQAKINLDAEKAAASHALQSDNQDLREQQLAHKDQDRRRRTRSSAPQLNRCSRDCIPDRLKKGPADTGPEWGGNILTLETD